MPAIKMGEFPPEMNEVSRPGVLSRGFRRETRFAGDAQTPRLSSVSRRASRIWAGNLPTRLIMIIQIIMIQMQTIICLKSVRNWAENRENGRKWAGTRKKSPPGGKKLGGAREGRGGALKKGGGDQVEKLEAGGGARKKGAGIKKTPPGE